MPFNGSGVYSAPVADFPVVTNTVISSTHFNNTINDIATGISNCIAKDGQSTPTANIKLGGFKLTGVGAPTVTNDALTFGQPGTMTTLTATTSVVTPLVQSSGDLTLSTATRSVVLSQANNTFAAGSAMTLGTASIPWTPVFATAIDSGTTGSLSLRTNNGQVAVEIVNTASAVSKWQLIPNTAGNGPVLQAAGETNTNSIYRTNGTGLHIFQTGASPVTQFQVLDTASSTRNITVTGSNGGNPTISTTAGSLAITPAVVLGSSLSFSGTVASTGTIRMAANDAPQVRNNGNSADMFLPVYQTINSVADVLVCGDGNSNGMLGKARSKAGAPTTSDIPAGDWAVWRDTTGATTKLYYNNAGAIQSVALA